jgi:lipoate-protein ligase A
MPESTRTPFSPGGSRAVFVDSAGCSEEFREDERLLRAAAPAVRVTVLSDRALSYGVSIRSDAAFLDRARAEGLPVARRTSGGSGVLHEVGDLAWSVVLPRTHAAVGRDYLRAYARLGAGVVRFLRRQGGDGAWVPSPELARDCCVLSGRGEVLSVRGRIVGGAAQHVTASALLHQGMVSTVVDRALVARLFAIGDAAVVERLGGLRDLGIVDPAERLAQQLAEELAALLRGVRT